VGKSKSHKAQHFIPRTYLSAWCDPDTPKEMEPYVWRFSCSGDEVSRRSPNNIFKETDFYTLIDAEGQRDLRLENALSGIEGRFSEIRRKKLSQHKPLAEDEKRDLALFAVALHFRTKAQRDFQREQWGRVQEMNARIEEQMRRSTPEERQSFIRTFPVRDPEAPSLSAEDVDRLAENPMQHMFREQVRTLLPIVSSMRVLVLMTDDPLGFITSDNPCVLMDPDQYKRPPMYRAARIAHPEATLTMPISPQEMVMYNWERSGYALTNRVILDECNRTTRFYAYEHFIVNRNEKRDEWFAKRQAPDDAWEKVVARERMTSRDA
jgi:Protein of unknown function (DUF4238)